MLTLTPIRHRLAPRQTGCGADYADEINLRAARRRPLRTHRPHRPPPNLNPPPSLYTTLLQDTPPLPSPPALRAGGEGRGEAPIHFTRAPIDGLLFCRGLWRFRMEATVTALNPLDGTSHCRRRRHRHRESFHLVRPAKVRGGLSAPQSFHECWPGLHPHRGLRANHPNTGRGQRDLSFGRAKLRKLICISASQAL